MVQEGGIRHTHVPEGGRCIPPCLIRTSEKHSMRHPADPTLPILPTALPTHPKPVKPRTGIGVGAGVSVRGPGGVEGHTHAPSQPRIPYALSRHRASVAGDAPPRLPLFLSRRMMMRRQKKDKRASRPHPSGTSSSWREVRMRFFFSFFLKYVRIFSVEILMGANL